MGKRRIIREGDLPGRGFSLLELMLALSILIIVASIAYPLFQSFVANGNLRSAARDIMADFISLKQKAMAESATYQISFDVGNNTYLIQRIQPPPPPPPLQPQPYTKSPVNFSKDIKIQNVAFGSGTSVNFEARGILNPAGNLILVNSRGSTAKITCNIAGRIYVEFKMQ
jgi:prepilin-type N-terminal cleavage/methylation domain-containing protein